MFCPVLRIDTDCLQIIIVGKFLQIIAYGFAALMESQFHQFGEVFKIFCFTDTVFHRNHAHDGRVNLRRRIKGLGRYFNQHFHIEEILQHDAQTAIVVGFRLCHHAFDHFFLQHKVHIDHIVCHFAQSEQKRRGNIVRQVANNFFLAFNAVEIKLQYIAFVYHQFVCKRQGFQTAYDVAVDFANMQAVEFFRQRLGNGGQARADFNHDIIRLRSDCVDNIANNPRILQKILPEAFPGLMFFHIFLQASCLRQYCN